MFELGYRVSYLIHLTHRVPLIDFLKILQLQFPNSDITESNHIAMILQADMTFVK